MPPTKRHQPNAFRQTLPAAQERKADTAVCRWVGAGTPVVDRGNGVENKHKGLADIFFRANVHPVVVLLYVAVDC